MRLVFVLILAVLAANAQDTQIGRGVNFYSVQKEAAMGATLAAQVQREATFIDSAVVRDYVNRIGARLAAQIPTAPFPYTFAVIAGDPNTTHEPLSLPGGYIFVPGPLILAANDEAEFAGMLAHSMAHVAERHATREATRATIGDQGTTIPLIFMGGWTGYGIGQDSSVLLPAGFLKSRRQFEDDADALAVTMTSRAGFDPEALVRYIGRVPPTEVGTTSTAFATLPTPDQRVASMRTAIQALPQQTYVTPDRAGFTGVQAEVRRLMPVAERPQLQRVATVDRPALKRRNPAAGEVK
jgi:predicted Zn-dependent protease